MRHTSAIAKQVQTSIERALAILDSFKMGDQALSLAALAQRTGLYKSTILRLCEALQRQSYLERLDGSGYRLGAAAVRLGEICKRSNRIDAIVPPELAPSLRTNSPRSLPIVTRGEYDPELATVACGVFGPDDELLGVIALTGPRTRFQPRPARTMGAALLKACQQLTMRSGGDAAVCDRTRPKTQSSAK
ncbi:MAG: helix-turn-helix domain-containing protein [Hyphomicrobiales bacterium]